jgi:erythromycin esterase-like protein
MARALGSEKTVRLEVGPIRLGRSHSLQREPEGLSQEIRNIARPLADAGDLDPLLDAIGDARYVLLGEASHGTSEYYSWRARLSQRLIREKGFSFLAVEGDWPDCYRVNRYVKGYRGAGESAREVLHAFDRWPTWMWANWEVVALAEWLKGHNQSLDEGRKVGFYGLDVYSLWESLHSLMSYLKRTDPEALAAAERAFRCFEPYGEDVQEYARATAFVPTSCEDEVVGLLGELRGRSKLYENDPEAAFNAEQSALVVVGAERYYRAMVRGGPESWNVRDHHMADTLDRLMVHHRARQGQRPKAIVWEHNTHIGDARATDMANAGMTNIGQLARERHEGEGVFLVGFGSYRGSVIAGRSWGAKMERMPVPEAREGSWEELLHGAVGKDGLLLLSGAEGDALFEPRGHRAIGVVYNPAHERYGNYVTTILPERYDAFLYLDESQALHPLHLASTDGREPPDTYPWGV